MDTKMNANGQADLSKDGKNVKYDEKSANGDGAEDGWIQVVSKKRKNLHKKTFNASNVDKNNSAFNKVIILTNFILSI